jgi:osmotically-inducible protein OsmY
MERTRILGIAALLVLGTAGAASADKNREDERLEQRVEQKLGDTRHLEEIQVDVAEGVVTLRGEVATRAEKARAEKLARGAGARRVENQIAVDADKAARRIVEDAAARKQKIDESAQRQKDEIDRRADAAKAKVDRSDRSNPTPVETGETTRGAPVQRVPDGNAVLDPLVTSKVKSRLLADDLLMGTQINVDTTSDGVVTLRGTVTSEAARARALQITRMTSGVSKVVDALEVRP